MAASFFRKLTNKHQAMDAGSFVGKRQGTIIHEYVIKCMEEQGYDLSKNVRKQLTQDMAEVADKIIVMDERQNLPDFLINSQKVTFWNIDDAADKSLEFHRKIRDKNDLLPGLKARGIL
jgi:protein-tyrosine-phosphatase